MSALQAQFKILQFSTALEAIMFKDTSTEFNGGYSWGPLGREDIQFYAETTIDALYKGITETDEAEHVIKEYPAERLAALLAEETPKEVGSFDVAGNEITNFKLVDTAGHTVFRALNSADLPEVIPELHLTKLEEEVRDSKVSQQGEQAPQWVGTLEQLVRVDNQHIYVMVGGKMAIFPWPPELRPLVAMIGPEAVAQGPGEGAIGKVADEMSAQYFGSMVEGRHVIGCMPRPDELEPESSEAQSARTVWQHWGRASAVTLCSLSKEDLDRYIAERAEKH